jgi:thiamine biosynthesis protein ThiS
MEIKVNGQNKSVAAATIEELIHELDLSKESLVVEHNGHIIKQQYYASTTLRPSDVLELLNFVGGG